MPINDASKKSALMPANLADTMVTGHFLQLLVGTSEGMTTSILGNGENNNKKGGN